MNDKSTPSIRGESSLELAIFRIVKTWGAVPTLAVKSRTEKRLPTTCSSTACWPGASNPSAITGGGKGVFDSSASEEELTTESQRTQRKKATRISNP